MNNIKRIGAVLLAICLTAGSAQAAKPDATLRLSGGAVAAGVGINWSKGTLTYKGKTYPVTVRGLDLGKVGITKVTATGQVFGMKSLADFDGTYTTAGTDLTLAGGHSGVTLKNQNDVKVVVSATSKGIDLTVGGSGVTMKIKK